MGIFFSVLVLSFLISLFLSFGFIHDSLNRDIPNELISRWITYLGKRKEEDDDYLRNSEFNDLSDIFGSKSS
jgi:hypothetical protein